jgi:hypothetical protein
MKVGQKYQPDAQLSAFKRFCILEEAMEDKQVNVKFRSVNLTVIDKIMWKTLATMTE